MSECPYPLTELQTRFNLILDAHGEPTADAYHTAYEPVPDAGDGIGYELAPGKHRYVVYEVDGDNDDGVDVWVFETADDVVQQIAIPLGHALYWRVTKVFDMWRSGTMFDTPIDVSVVVRAAWADVDGSDVFVETQVLVGGGG